MADQVAIDPQTGERITATTIDPSTGERVAAPQQGFFSSAADASGLSALIHPIDAIMGIPGAVKQSGANIADAYRNPNAETIGRALPIVGPLGEHMAQQAKDGNYAGMLGTYLGAGAGVAAPKVLKGAPAAAEAALPSTAKALQEVGDAAQTAGSKVINETVGSYKADFKRGANPGRGYLSTGNGVAVTMRSLAEKAENAKATVGSSIQKVINASGAKGALIPFQDIADAIGKPLREAHDAETSPGGTGNVVPFENYSAQFKKTLTDAYKRGGMTAQEVFDLKKQIAAKAKFNNTTPEGIMDVRQSQVGALGGLLKSVIPDLAPLNQAYQDLVKLSDRAAWRAESGAMSLGRMVGHGGKGFAAIAAGTVGGAEAGLGAGAALAALDSTAGRTAIASGLYNGGKVLANAGSKLEDWLRSRRP